MGYNFRSYNQRQSYLLPPSLDKWLPQNHLARFISETVDQMDLSAFKKAYRANGQGNAAYHPAMMVKILLYAYAVGMPSSRKIAKALVDDVAFRWLAAGNFPDFRTISGFRKRHLKALEELFPQVLLICKSAGLVKAGVIALDGTKVRANASICRNKDYEQLSEEEERLKRKVRELLEQAESIDQEEDELYGDKRGDELPEELSNAKERLARIREAKRLLEERNRERESSKKKGAGNKCQESVKPEGKINMTDSDSRIQKTSKGYIQGYNAQAVATEDQIIVAQDVVTDANDVHQFKPMVEQAQENLAEIGESAKTILADAGYCSEENLEYLDSQEGINGLVSTRKERDMRRSKFSDRVRERSKLPRYKRMDKKLRRPVNSFIYGFRKKIIEPVFGQLKWCRGFSGFLLRGLEKVKVEFSLWCSTHNMLKLYRHMMKKGQIAA